MTTALIDCDYFVYKNCAACEEDTDFTEDVIVVSSRFSDVQRAIGNNIKRVKDHLHTKDVILFFSDSVNFRKEIDPSYKGHRNRKKPCGYKRAIEWLKGEYEVIVYPTLEADDALGIYATDPEKCFLYEHIIVSPDKDLKQIPCRLYNMTDPEVFEITAEEGTAWHLQQTLTGDQTDGYGGCPGIGEKKALALFEKYGCNWFTVLEAFDKAGLTEEDALRNARLARILQSSDYDSSTQRPILWNPPTE